MTAFRIEASVRSRLNRSSFVRIETEVVISGAILGVAGLITTLLSSLAGLYFVARARTAPFREHLYEQQLALVVRIVQTVGKVRVFSPLVYAPGSEFRDRALSDLRVEVRQLSEASDLSAAILPTELYIEVSQLTRVVLDFVAAQDSGADTAWFPDALAGHSAKTALLARTLLGVDELSTESATIFRTGKDIEKISRMNPNDIAVGIRREMEK